MSVLHPVHRYARDVLASRIVAGPLVRLACERHERDRAARRWLFDATKADRIIAFFSQFLRLPDSLGADGQPAPFVLQPWQVFVVGSLFGWVDAHGLRRFREGYVESGKGSGKTPLMAGIGLYGLMSDGERAAEIYAAAVDRDQAMILFRDAKRIVEASPELDRRIGPHRTGNLVYEPTLSFFRPFSREQGQKSGVRPHMALIDEVHEHPSGEIVNKLRAGVKRRTQPLSLEITNSGYDRTSICWEHHEHSRRVLDGTLEDDRWFCYVCGLDEGDDPLLDESCWPKANPSIGVTVTRDYLRRQVQNAINLRSERNTVLRLNFCVWTQSSVRWIEMGKWHACDTMPTEAELRAVPCVAGLDLGRSDDFSAFARVWELPDGRVAVKMRFWLPQVTVDKTPLRPYQQWVDAGWLDVSEGDVTDYAQIEQDILDAHLEQPILQLGYDPKFATELVQRLQGEGLDPLPLRQGFNLNEALRRLETLINDGQLCHGGDAILGWMADNAVVSIGREGDLRLDKQKSTEKVDGIAALSMALACLLRYQVSDFDGLVVA